MIQEALLHIGLLVVVAKLAEGLLRRIGLISIVAYTLAGVLLGPVAGIVEPTSEIELFLGIGVFVLFFLIGLEEIDLPGFMATIRGRFFIAGALSVVISVLISLLVTSDFLGVDFALNLEFTKALCVAGILSLSSLGIVAKVLSDKGLLKELIGLRIFTAVIIAEVISLLVVGVTIGELDHDHSVVCLLVLVGEIVGFVVLTWIISAKVLPRTISILHRLVDVPELSFGLLMGASSWWSWGQRRSDCTGHWGRCSSGPPCRGCPTACATTSCPECAAPRRACSFPSSSPRPACIWISPSSACRHRPKSPCCSSRCWESWPAPSSAPSWRGWTRRWS